MGAQSTQQDRLHDKHGSGTDPSRDASKQDAWWRHWTRRAPDGWR